MTRQLLLGGVLLSAGMSAAVLSLEAPISAVQEDPFPHAAHQGLFPLCTGCHEGIPSGDEADWYPEPQSCRGCHDGVERDEVVWNAP